ncbi:MAG: DUF3108 domain-containing protein [Pseudomonadota bacterium]
MTSAFLPKGLAWTGPFFAAALLGLGPAKADERTYAYQVAWGHLTLAEAHVDYQEDQDRYHLESRGETKGFLAMFFSWQGEAETHGRFIEGQRQPQRHNHLGMWEERTRQTQVTWPDDGKSPVTQNQPAPNLEEVTPVPAESLAGTVDPFSLLLTTMDRLARDGRCAGAAKLWDGRRRYDLEILHLGEEELISDRPWAYQGPAVICSFKANRIGGFWRDNEEWREAQENESTPPKVWAAQIEPGEWAIVRAEVETPYGTVVARLLPEGGLDSSS